MKPALLVIDIQNAFLDISSVMTQSINEAIRYTNAAIDLFREKELPIIAVQQTQRTATGSTQGFEPPRRRPAYERSRQTGAGRSRIRSA